MLDLITSPDGTLEVGGVQHDLRDGFLSDRGGAREGEIFALTCMPDLPSGFERCESDDGATIVLRSGPSSIRFKAFKSSFLGYWKMGAKITTEGPDFEAAQIDSRYYFPTLGQVCTAINGVDSDTNDDYLDEYEGGLFSEQPVRVVSLCRAQWNGRRIAGIVSKGQECSAMGVEPFPSGFPEDWPPLGQPVPAGLTFTPSSIAFGSVPVGDIRTRVLTIENTAGASVSVSIAASPPGPFFWPAFNQTISPNSSAAVIVEFRALGAGQAQAVLTATSDAAGSPHSIPLSGRGLPGVPPR